MDINKEYKNPCLDKHKRQLNPDLFCMSDEKEISIARHVVIVTLLVSKYADILGFNKDEKETAIEMALSHEDGKHSNGDNTLPEDEKRFVSESTNNYLKMYKGDFSNVQLKDLTAMMKIADAVVVMDSLAFELEMTEGYSREISTSNKILKNVTIKPNADGKISVEIVEDNEYIDRLKENEDFLNSRGYYEKLTPKHKVELIDYYLDTIYSKLNNNNLGRKL